MAKKLFFLTILGIFTLIFLGQILTPLQLGTIKSIKTSGTTARIQLENRQAELILFDAKFIELEKGDIIKFKGREEFYRNKTQIVVDRIFKE
jgi:DNA/RNA endonuclease YhcR with UshA esterase domain